MSQSTIARRLAAVTATGAALMLALTGCTTDSAATSPAASSTVEITDNHGTQTVSTAAKNVVATDNRLFQTLADWGIPLAAAPKNIIESDSPYKTDDSVVNLGDHREPDLEALVGVEPDLVLNGQRFATHYDKIKGLLPDTPIVELDPRDGQPFDAELKRQVTTLGTIFNREGDAQKIVDDFDAAVARVKAAYKPNQTVIGLITSGGEINYAAPGTGRTVGPVFDILGLTPAIQASGSSDHQGDDISVEAIAQANPDWLIVLDRDAAVSLNSGAQYTPANDLLAQSPALQGVTAVKQQHIVYLPQNTYLNEGIQTYTTFFNQLADAFEAN